MNRKLADRGPHTVAPILDVYGHMERGTRCHFRWRLEHRQPAAVETCEHVRARAVGLLIDAGKRVGHAGRERPESRPEKNAMPLVEQVGLLADARIDLGA